MAMQLESVKTIAGLKYNVIATRPPDPVIPVIPPAVKRSQLTRIRGTMNSTVPNPPDDRDTQLAPFYGQLGVIGSPYSVFGPTVNQVGLTVTYASLTDWNASSTNTTSVTTPMNSGNYIVGRKIHGRLSISGTGQILARNCILDGPLDPTIASGETAIIDSNSINSGTPISRLVDCVIYMRTPHPRWNAQKGGHIILERCHIFWVTDGAGPYTNPSFMFPDGNEFPTAFKMLGCRVEKLVYWPGSYYSATNGISMYTNTGTYGSSNWMARLASDKLPSASYIDTGHDDGNHVDCIEVHNGWGTHNYNPVTKMWDGDGIYIVGNALICDDAFGKGNPNPTIPISPIPLLGWGDNPKRGLAGGGQSPGMPRPPTSWSKPVDGTGLIFPGNGVSLYIGHVTPSGKRFESNTTVVAHGNYHTYGNMGMQEQKKTSAAFIEFTFYDNWFGPDYYHWNSNNRTDMYPVRINDNATSIGGNGANVMPNWTTGPVRIAPHPVTGAPPFGAGASNKWWDPTNRLQGSFHQQPLLLGSSSTPGIRVL